VIKYVALYRAPDGPPDGLPDGGAGFDGHYFGSHVPLVDRVPGLLRTELAKVQRTVVGGPEYYLIAELYFESREAMKAAFGSPEWAASAANLQEWGGMDLVTMFTAQVVDDSGQPV
jgi:uncharacterized protein (TIGR02118 family)